MPLFGKKNPEEMSLEELERLLLLKRREARQRRLRERSTTAQSYKPPSPGVQRYDELAFLDRRRGSVMTRGLYRGARWYERLLVVVEVLALVGLLTAIFFYVQDWRANRELMRVPDDVTVGDTTLAPGGTSANVVETVLPGRPPPPPNAQVAAIPVLYAEWLESETTSVAAPPVDEETAQKLPARIVIPSIGVDAPIVEGDDWEALKRGVGHHLGSANPGERGNMVLSAHNDIFGEIFRYLENVEVGDEVLVYDGAGREYRYIVVQKRIVEPTAVEVLAPSQEPIATLITCHPYLIDTQRLVVIAELDTSR